MRDTPSVPLTDCPVTYARFLAEGWDSVQEVFNVQISEGLVALLEVAQAEAKHARARGDGLASIDLNGTPYRVRAYGTKNARWIIESDDVMVFFSSRNTEWGVSIRYLSGALWREGAAAPLRDAFFKSAKGYVPAPSASASRVTRADYCFDFHSPAFTREHRLGSLLPRFVCHRSVKKRDDGVLTTLDHETGSAIGVGARGQTATAGSRSHMQVQIYNKSDEITEQSGKAWLYELWAKAADGEVFDKDVHRLEVRFGPFFFRNRNLTTPDQVFAAREQIVTEALYRIRLTVKTRDSNLRRRPIHPIWSEAIRRCGKTTLLPLGRVVTGRRDELAKQMREGMAGTLRSHMALVYGVYDRRRAIDELNEVIRILEDDEKHQTKFQQALLRYSGVDEAK